MYRPGGSRYFVMHAAPVFFRLRVRYGYRRLCMCAGRLIGRADRPPAKRTAEKTAAPTDQMKRERHSAGSFSASDIIGYKIRSRKQKTEKASFFQQNGHRTSAMRQQVSAERSGALISIISGTLPFISDSTCESRGICSLPPHSRSLESAS